MSDNTKKVAAVPESPEVLALREQLAKMQAEQAQLKAKLEEQTKNQLSKVTFSIGEKGGVSVYGFGRFPVTLYGEQWDTLLSEPVQTALKKFLADNRDKLMTKAQKTALVAEAKAKADAEAKAQVASLYEVVIVDGKPVTVRKDRKTA